MDLAPGMIFLNPIVILGLDQTDVSLIDSTVIRKAKRIVLAEIELSDEGEIVIGAATIGKADIENAVESISNLANLRYYHLIANDRPLQNFLSASNEFFFSDFEQKPEYLTQEFLALVGPFFVKSYNEALRNAFTSNEHQLLQSILSTVPLCTQEAFDGLYEGVREAIRFKLQEVNLITERITSIDPDSQRDLIVGIPPKVMDIVNPQSLNLLPTQLQTLRNNCSSAIRNLSVEVFNHLDDEKIAEALLNHAISIHADGMTKFNLENDSFKIKEIVLQRAKHRSAEPIIRKAAIFIQTALAKLEALQNGKGDMSDMLNWVIEQIDVSEIDKLDSEFIEIKDQVALTLRALSVECWNRNHDLKNATMLIAQASRMETASREIKANINEAASSLAALKSSVANVNYIPQQHKPVAQQSERSDQSWIQKNPALAISLACFAIGGLILAAGGGWVGGVIILLGFGFFKAI